MWLIVVIVYPFLRLDDDYILNCLGVLNITILSYKGIQLTGKNNGNNPGEKILCMSLSIKIFLLWLVFATLFLTKNPSLYLTNIALTININVVLLLGSIYTMFLFDRINMHKKEALTDYLTDIPNRRSFMIEVKKLRCEAVKTEKPGVVVVCDIDNFKKINDTYGHDAGDIIIKEMAKVFSNSLRQNDLCARMGGEEFAMYLSDTTAELALSAVERIRAAVASREVTINGCNIQFTASFGYDALSEDKSLDRVLRNADKAMYKAKDAGRNRVKLFESGM